MKYAFVVSINNHFLYGLNCTMNAMKHFGTSADFEIAYSNIKEEDRERYNNAFPFKVKWTPMKDLLGEGTKKAPFWCAPWILAEKIIDNYDAICVLQGDNFLFSNMNVYFDMAAKLNLLIAATYPWTYISGEDLPYGNPEAVYHRSRIAFYDQIVFLNSMHKKVLVDTAGEQEIAPKKGETDHPCTTLNRAICRHLSSKIVHTLDGHIWCGDYDWWVYKLTLLGKDRIINDRHIRMRGRHQRWWQAGIYSGEIERAKKVGMLKEKIERFTHNCNLVKDLMQYFNEMTPSVKNEYYVKERLSYE